MPITPAARRWLSKATGIASRDLQVTPLRGANSSLVFRLESARNPDASRFVLRLFHDAHWLREEPDLAAHEAAALQEAGHTSLCVPELLAWENEPDIMGAPFVLMSHLRGEVQLKPRDLGDWSAGLSQQLALLHAHCAPNFTWKYHSWLDREHLRPPSWAQNSKLWERAIGITHQKPPSEPCVFLHRDFHPVNVLWQDETISGVVDWVNACQGAASVDVAHCRTNLAVLFGIEAADTFLAAYENRAGSLENQPYWDVCSILDMALPQPEWYRPWSEFGLKRMPDALLQQRDEAYLQSVLKRF
jgi:aminoglycoside phosphotransferase (APT) family kinase protein